MNPVNSIANSLITVLTGSNPSELQQQAAAAEQAIILAVEVIIVLMLFMVVELGVLVFQKRS